MRLDVKPFRCGTDKEAALKPLEEAAEVYGAWQNADCERANGLNDYMAMEWLADELADCVTACCNLADRYGLDLQAALDRVERRNVERGRY